MQISFLIKIVLAALGIWLVPFLVSIPFYGSGGTLQTSFVVFKVAMLAILLIVSYIAFRWVYRSRAEVTLTQAVLIGLCALAVSVVLDQFTVLPLSGMSLGDYALQIGVMYLLLIGMSVIVSRQSQR